FKVPAPYIQEETSTVPGIDGQKMSKSYNNAIELFGDVKNIRNKIMSITMDSRSPSEPKPDAENNTAVRLLKLVASTEVYQDVLKKLTNGQMSYGELKGTLHEHYTNYFNNPRKLYEELQRNPDN